MKHQSLFAIGIPTINRADLLQPALQMYSRAFPNTIIYVVDNGYQDFDLSKLTDKVLFTANDQNIGVAGSWNQLADKIYNGIPGITKPCDYALILNDDIYLGRSEADIAGFILGTDFTFAVGPENWCAFIMPKIIYKKVGNFDEKFFPAYFEDNDYAYRLLLAGFPPETYTLLSPEVYRNSQTIEKDRSLNDNFENNRQYFIEKWGGQPNQETFMIPFNQQTP